MKIENDEDTHVGLVRQANEDFLAHLKLDWGAIFTVCDGMGGHVGGATASKIAVKSILEYLGQDHPPEDPKQALRESLVFANDQIYGRAMQEPGLRGMGTTAVILMIIDTSVWFAHVGDSRIYINSDGHLSRLTRDHSFVQALVDSGAIAEEEMELHPRKNELTRALGTQNAVEPEVAARPAHPKKGDTFLLCSDGLYGMVEPAEIQRIINNHDSLSAIIDRLISEANHRGGYDNITVQLVQILQSPHLASRFEEISVRSDLAYTKPGLGNETDQAENDFQIKQPFFQKPAFLIGAVALVLALIIGAVFAFKRSDPQPSSATNTDKIENKVSPSKAGEEETTTELGEVEKEESEKGDNNSETPEPTDLSVE